MAYYDSYNVLGDSTIFSHKLLAIILTVRGTGKSDLNTICKRNSFLVSQPVLILQHVIQV